MAINKWRRVCGSDDGCEIFQCLKCGNDWESRTTPQGCRGWNSGHIFCGYCGTKWEGEVEWDSGIEYWSRWPLSARIIWVIEKRDFLFPNAPTTYLEGYYQDYSAKEILGVLKSRREFEASYGDSEYCKTEFRARRATADEVKSQHILYARDLDFAYYVEYQKKWGGRIHETLTHRRWHRIAPK